MRTGKLALTSQLVIALVAITLIGCGANKAAAPAPAEAVSTEGQAAPKPTRILPEAVLPDGTRLTLELAITNEEIGQGLMFRKSLADDRGMLFLFKEERVPSFWMKNTLISLDMVFLSSEGITVDIIHNALPCTGDPCPQYVSKAPAAAVLELAAGVAGRHGLKDGIRLQFERVPGYPNPAIP